VAKSSAWLRRDETRAAASARKLTHPNATLAAGRSPPRSLPSSLGGLIEPERQVTTPLQPSLVGWPAPDLVAGLREQYGGVVLERHAQKGNGSAEVGDPPRLSAIPCTNVLSACATWPTSAICHSSDSVVTEQGASGDDLQRSDGISRPPRLGTAGRPLRHMANRPIRSLLHHRIMLDTEY
jgi:hypothetical protein